MTTLHPILQYYAKPVPTPPGFTSHEIVRRAIEFDGPPRIPYSFIQPLESDFTELAAVASGDADISSVPVGEMVFDDWGVGRRSSGTLWGHAEVHPLQDLSALDGYRCPDVTARERFSAAEALARAGNEAGKYVVGADPIMSIERLRLLVGFDNLMVALYTERPQVERLLDKLVDMTLDVMRVYAGMGGVHGFMTWEDWGLQTSLQIRPEQWREIFKPRYARIVEATHEAGMHYLFHCCGWILEIIPDLVEIGVDVLQLDQPALMGVDRLADEFGGGWLHVHSDAMRLLHAYASLDGLVAVGLEDWIKPPFAVDHLDEIRGMTGDVPLMINIEKERLLALIGAGTLPGNALYWVSGVRSADEANRLARIAHGYRAPHTRTLY